ncbi:MAG TPA: hypothetical protein VFW18_02605 [Gaiellales bacterium]|nr:hypothetical protein [Gaiellales bacterium]
MLSRYLIALGLAAYRRAFALTLAYPNDAHLRMTRQETDAFRAASLVDEQRALGLGSTGVPLPFTLDPSIIMSGTDVLNRSAASRAMAQAVHDATIRRGEPHG